MKRQGKISPKQLGKSSSLTQWLTPTSSGTFPRDYWWSTLVFPLTPPHSSLSDHRALECGHPCIFGLLTSQRRQPTPSFSNLEPNIRSCFSHSWDRSRMDGKEESIGKTGREEGDRSSEGLGRVTLTCRFPPLNFKFQNFLQHFYTENFIAFTFPFFL